LTVCYLDASAWVKRYFEEPGSSWIDRLFNRETALACANLGHVETAAALARQQRARQLDATKLRSLEAQLDREWADFLQLDVTESVANRAVALTRKWSWRGADAVHLAAAWELKEQLKVLGADLLFVASDRELLDAAEATGITVENPVLAS